MALLKLRPFPLPIRRIRLLYGFLGLAVVLFFLVCFNPDPPSNWEELYKWEDNLPQHDLHLPFPEGKAGKYVYFQNQIQYMGWNNLLNEVYALCCF
jgi:hypothetical protein